MVPQSLGPAPDCWQEGQLRYGSGLTLGIAKKMLEEGEKEALKQNVPMVMAIDDAGGHILAVHRMENVMLCSLQIAIDKAYTAVFGKMNTTGLFDAFRNGQLVPLFFHERWITFSGGFPLIKDRVIYGGIGVSGGVVEDLYVARAAIKAGGFDTNEVDQAITEYERTLKKNTNK